MKTTSEFVNVTVNGEAHTVKRGTRLSNLLNIALPCGGHGKCGKCKVIATGELSPLTDSEKHALSDTELEKGVRLACHTTVEGECSLSLLTAPNAQNKILTDAQGELSAPNPAFLNYGAAIDVGTTTLAAKLYDKSGACLAEYGRMNPQSVWGADVISRIEASMNGEAQNMATAICMAIDEILTALSHTANIDLKSIDAVVLTGNTAMLHLLTATPTEPLSHAPFDAKRLFGETLLANKLGLQVLDTDVKVYLPSCISAFVGADMVCALLASGICEKDDTALLADIGTNGEMGLWHNGKLTVCSTAAGPAFEGVGISMGMSGADGAIDRVTLDGNKLRAHVIGETTPRGICGSGLVDAVACLLKSETLDETGYLEDDPATIAAPVVLTQQDIRMVQLAKSAICAGLCTLLQNADTTTEQVNRLYIAGGFGSYLNMQSAGAIGLIPTELSDRVGVIGNAALTGAAMLLLNRDLRETTVTLARQAAVSDLASSPVFSELYMNGMMFE